MERAGRLVASLGISYWGPEDAINSCLNALAGLLTHRLGKKPRILGQNRATACEGLTIMMLSKVRKQLKSLYTKYYLYTTQPLQVKRARSPTNYLAEAPCCDNKCNFRII